MSIVCPLHRWMHSRSQTRRILQSGALSSGGFSRKKSGFRFGGGGVIASPRVQVLTEVQTQVDHSERISIEMDEKAVVEAPEVAVWNANGNGHANPQTQV